jgi:hypothetical protein
MAIRPCPKCQQPLEIPQPLPETIRCNHCGAVFKGRKKEGGDESAPSTAPALAAAASAAAAPTAAAPAPGNQWYYTQQGKRFGPCTLDDLKRLVGEGKLTGKDMVLQAGVPQWRPVEQIPELTPPKAADEFAVATPTTKVDAPPAAVIGSSPNPPPIAATPPAPQPAQAPAPAPAPDPTLPAATNAAPAAAPRPPRRPGKFLSWLHATLPKPILFGLYGAVGALLGALLLGELIQLLIHPKAQTVAPLQIAVPSGVVVYPGGENVVTVKIARQGIEGPVRLEVQQGPPDILFSDVEIDADKSEGELSISANENAALGKFTVQVRGTAPKAAKVEVEQTMHFTVETTPPTLEVAVSPDVTVFAGYSNRIGVEIARQRFTEAVRLQVLNLPRGVPPPAPVLINPGATKAGIAITTTKDADLGVHDLKLRAESVENDKITTVKTFSLRIQPPPGKLRMTVSPLVTVFAGDKNQFTVMIARHEFNDPIEVHAEGLPDGVDIPTVTFAPNETKKTLEVNASKLDPKEQVAGRKVRIVANAIGEKIEEKQEFELQVKPHPGKLRLAVASQVMVFPGDENKVTVKIARGDFKAAVDVQVEGLPTGVQIAAATIPADKSEATLIVSAKTLDAKTVLNQKVRVTAKAQTAENITDAADLQLRVEPPPPQVQLAVPAEIAVYPGGEARFTVKIARHRFEGPVQITGAPVAGLLSFPPLTIPADQTEGEMKVFGDPKAFLRKVKEAKAQLSARGADGKASLPQPESVKVKILLPPSDLKLSVSEKVEVHQGGKCQFTVKVARGGFVGPVQVRFDGLPDGVTIPPVTLAANENEKVVDGQALIKTPVGDHKIQAPAAATVTAPDGKKPADSKEFRKKKGTRTVSRKQRQRAHHDFFV